MEKQAAHPCWRSKHAVLEGEEGGLPDGFPTLAWQWASDWGCRRWASGSGQPASLQVTRQPSATALIELDIRYKCNARSTQRLGLKPIVVIISNTIEQ